jgi:hypothetical protein
MVLDMSASLTSRALTTKSTKVHKGKIEIEFCSFTLAIPTGGRQIATPPVVLLR